MTYLEEQIGKIGKQQRIGLMTHQVIGYPSLSATVSLVKTMRHGGADFMELQIPFSDPIADGPTIMKACYLALKNGTSIDNCFQVVGMLVKELTIPFLLMAYYNTVFAYGVERFIRQAKVKGCSGLIIPDIPPEEEGQEGFISLCQKYQIHHIRVLSPASTEERIRKNVQIAKGFIYFVSRFGTTGAKEQLDEELHQYISRIRSLTDLPIAVGFGISQKKHIEALYGKAEIAVVGSAIIDIIEKYGKKNYSHYVYRFIQKLTR